VSKTKIEIRKPQYLDSKDVKEPVAQVKREPREERPSSFFGLLLLATYILSGLAIWYVYQKYSAHP
jgi:cytoskeletal protein RodZ